MPRPRAVLTLKESRFVAAYLADPNGTRAAIAAGYAPNSPQNARKAGYLLLRKAHILAAIEHAEEARRNVSAHVHGVTPDRIVEELSRIAFSNPKALFDAEDHLKPMSAIDDAVAAAISGFDVKHKGQRGEEPAPGDRLTKVRRVDKLRALELLMKYLGILREQHVHTGEVQHTVSFYLPDNGRTLPGVVLTVPTVDA